MNFKNFLGHLKTVHNHRKLVRKGCFKIGLYYQGLVHDLSKYSPVEFKVGVKYWQGDRSPNNAEREDKGFSEAWMHHKGRNKHHYEYWNDYSLDSSNKPVAPVDMPKKYIAEMLMDRIAASKTYKGKDYNDSCPLEYYLGFKHDDYMTEYTKEHLEMLLRLLSTDGENALYSYIKNEFLK